MNITISTTYTAPLARVLAVLASEELTAARAAQLTHKTYQFSTTTLPDGGCTTTIRASVAAAELPEQVRRFLRQGITATITSTFPRLEPETHSARVTNAVAIQGAPATGNAIFDLSEHNGHTSNSISVQFSVNVPFIGTRIEKEAAKHLKELLAADTALVNSLL